MTLKKYRYNRLMMLIIIVKDDDKLMYSFDVIDKTSKW